MGGGHSRTLLGFVVSVGLWLSAPSQSRAEVFSDLYIGASITSDAPYKVDGVVQEPGILCGAQCGTAKSPIGGLRVGYFFERFAWLGVAGDISGL
ncbi:MAG: hypothetical protein O7F08_05110, partial [Deltaproteobacteria bacterium]|nr:hypothetical protein [Deltaproteobacteria bacterium]